MLMVLWEMFLDIISVSINSEEMPTVGGQGYLMDEVALVLRPGKG